MIDNINIDKIKQMSIPELNLLAQDIRERIINVTSLNGGHLASNLGIVELTLAIHKVFDSPFDKVIFDVSHQTYTHKIITGRNQSFDTLRKFDGISGFTKYSESIHDAFEAGHSSTSISAGLGFLEAKKIYPNDIGDVICVVGDASVSNGLCFEALNYLAEHKSEKMIIIINDNNMSISKNVGFIAKKYNSIRIKKSFNFLKRIVPVRIKHALQYYAYKVDLFTSMGFKYFENIDGHDINELLKYLIYAKNSSRSTIIHVKTIKGKGYLPAENDSLGVWHGVGPFDISTGKQIKSNDLESFGVVLGKELINYAKTSKGNLLKVITPATILGSGLNAFNVHYPDKVIDVGIAEENALVIASALAKANCLPVVFIYATFLQRAYDELIHDIARCNSHVVLCVDRCGIVANDGDTHQGIYDMAFYNSIPGLTVLQPINSPTSRAMLNYALDKCCGPVIIRYPKKGAEEGNTYFNNELKWIKVKESTNNTYVITYGPNTIDVLNLVNDCHKEVGVIYALCTTPIDEEMLSSFKDSTLVFYEEVIKNGSLYVNSLQYVYEHNINCKLLSISLDNCYVPHGSLSKLKDYYKVSIKDLKELLDKLN